MFISNIIRVLLDSLFLIFRKGQIRFTDPKPVVIESRPPLAVEHIPNPLPELSKTQPQTTESAASEQVPKSENQEKLFNWDNPVIRKDGWGGGEYAASRTGHTHQGVDYEVDPGTQIMSPVDGVVTNHSVPYPSDRRYRGIQITTADKQEVKIFYCKPGKALGAKVKKGDVVASAQDVASKYNSRKKDVETKGLMKNHIHVELRKVGKVCNPKELLS